jgi:hypothetical protein
MRLSPKTSRPFIRFPKPVNLSRFYTGVHIRKRPKRLLSGIEHPRKSIFG